MSGWTAAEGDLRSAGGIRPRRPRGSSRAFKERLERDHLCVRIGSTTGSARTAIWSALRRIR